MKLQSVDIHGFRAISSLKIPFDQQLTVLHGNNAHGKTSVLSAIAVGLGLIPTLLVGSGGIGFRKTDLRNRERFSLVELAAIDGPTWSRWESRYGGALRADTPRWVGTKPLRDYVGQIAELIKSDEQANIPVFAFYDTDRAVFESPKRKTNFREGFSRFDAYVNALSPKPSFKALIEWFFAQQFVEQAQHRTDKSFSYRNPKLEVVRNAITKMLPDVSDPHIVPPVQFVVTRVDQAGHSELLSLDQLSGGYRIVLALAADLARRMAQANPHLDNPLESEAIVLIDEVELHLHPEWQQRVLNNLQNTFPNTHFIVSTHSPQVLTTVRPDQIVHLRASEDGVVAEASSGATYGARSGDVLEVEMGVEQRPKNAFTEKLADYLQMIRVGQGDGVDGLMLRAELDALSPHNPALIGADIEMRRRRLMRVPTNQPA